MSLQTKPFQRVYMLFSLGKYWRVSFLANDLTPLKTLTFADPEKIRELARRGGAWRDSESRQMLEHAIDTGRGGVYLRLRLGQYRKLRRLT